MIRNRFGRRTQPSSRADPFVKSARFVDAARAAAESHETWAEPADERDEWDYEPVSADEVEAAIEDGLRALRAESDRLNAEAEVRFAELEDRLYAAEESIAEVRRMSKEGAGASRHHPAVAHLADLEAQIKRLAEHSAPNGDGHT